MSEHSSALRFSVWIAGLVWLGWWACGRTLGALELWPRESPAAESSAADAPAAEANKGATPAAAETPLRVSLNTTAKLAGLASHNPADRLLFAQRDSALGLFRLRFDVKATWRDQASFVMAYEHSAQWSSFDRRGGAGGGLGGGGTSTGGLGSGAGTGHQPFRVTPLSDRIVNEDRVVWTHDMDLLLIAWHPAWGELTVGRQAIGLGRGILFRAVDLFAPFSPLAVDREWRPGVDAIRVEARTSATTSVEALLVGGESLAQSAGVLRARGFYGRFDGELLAGIRLEEPFIGSDFSAALGDAEVHGELLVTRLQHPHPDGEPWHNDRLAAKAVLGASYNFNVGDGLTAVAEYFYNGLAADRPERIALLLANPDFAARYQRGDLPTLTRHAVGGQLSYPFTPTITGTGSVVMSPRDGSGLFSPAVNWNVTDSVSLMGSGFWPWGARSQNGRLRSEYGASPFSVFGQVAWYL